MTDELKPGDLVNVKLTSTHYRKYHNGVDYYIIKMYETECLNGKKVTMCKIISQYEINNHFGSETIPLTELEHSCK